MGTESDKQRGRPRKQNKTQDSKPSTPPAHRNTALEQRCLLQALLWVLRENSRKDNAEAWWERMFFYIDKFIKPDLRKHFLVFFSTEEIETFERLYAEYIKKKSEPTPPKNAGGETDNKTTQLSRLMQCLRNVGCPWFYDRMSNTYYLKNVFWELPIRVDLSVEDQLALCLGRQLLHTLKEESCIRNSKKKKDEVEARYGSILKCDVPDNKLNLIPRSVMYKILAGIQAHTRIKITPEKGDDSTAFLAIPTGLHYAADGTWMLRYKNNEKDRQEEEIPLLIGIRNSSTGMS